jgi:hypothetical protein
MAPALGARTESAARHRKLVAAMMPIAMDGFALIEKIA